MASELKQSEAHALREYFAGREGELLSFVRALVEIESPSGDLEGNAAVVSLLAEAARNLGVETEVTLESDTVYGAHLRIRAFGGGDADAQATLILGHTDTVHPRGSLGARPWREEADGRIYAPGIFDMKANCALALESLRACATLDMRPKKPVVILLTCDEEVGSQSGRALVEAEARRAAHVLVFEPSAPGGRAKTARKGTGSYTVRAEGRAAHAGLDPEKGASAILEIARQIERLHALVDAARGVTVNAGVVSGGTRANVVAAEAQTEVDVRFSTMGDALRIEETILNLRPFDERVRLSVEGGINRPPLERSEAVVALYEHARRIASSLEFELGEASVGGASDGNFAAAVGATVLDGLGIEGDGAHAAHEHINRGDIARRGALLAGLLITL
ncbi:MAG TPA: M20 family metallopeptidase [Pyrinomonadaceae bacterium]|jgi:glutamate carboxypeptidase|nr:M20 family metallopeptidase [Pyrinomonadaceae bacterium]